MVLLEGSREKQLVKKDFENLTEEGNLGFYQSCEITTIFLLDEINHRPRNFFTIVVFEEKDLPAVSYSPFVTKKPIPINSYCKLGIMRYHKSVEVIEKDFAILLEDNQWKYEDNELLLEKLVALPKQFVPADGTNTVPLNSILKNNFYNGSYIIEFFDQEKNALKVIIESDGSLEKISNNIRDFMPLDLL